LPFNGDIADLFAQALGRKDQQPNIDLAKKLAKSGTNDDIIELFEYCKSGKKVQKSDAIKVIYELAQLRPSLVAPYIQNLIDLLATKNNRMIWGILQAINALADENPEVIIKNLNLILQASDRSSVIAKDNLMAILAKLNQKPRFKKLLTPVILQRLEHSAPNQFPTYAQLIAPTIEKESKEVLMQIILERRKSISSIAKLKRLDKTLRELQ